MAYPAREKCTRRQTGNALRSTSPPVKSSSAAMKGVADKFASFTQAATQRAAHGLETNPIALGADCTSGVTACQPLEVRCSGMPCKSVPT